MGTGWDDEKRGWGCSPPAAAGTPAPQGEGGLWHIHWHPGFQGPGKGAMSLPAHRGKSERCVGSKGPVRGSARAVRQAGPQGRHGGACVQGIALSPAAGFSYPFWFHTDAQGLRGGNGSEVPPTPSPPPREVAQGQPGAGDGGVGVRAKSTWEACGKQGQDTAVASRAARGLALALALIPQSSEGRAGHTLPAVALSATSPPLDRSRVGMAQKMLCRRLFPRPGAQRRRGELQGGGWAGGCPRSGGKGTLQNC